MMTDPISDMLTRIRNAAAARHREVVLPHSKLKFAIAKILERNGFLESTEKIVRGHGELKLTLRYENDTPVLRGIERVSTPGRRVYAASVEIPVVRSNQGFAIISTPSGIMTGGEAKARRLGGEIICKVY